MLIGTKLLHAFYPRPDLAFGYCHRLRLWVCVSVCVCINHEFVRTITHHSFKLGSPNYDQRYKIPWFSSLLVWGIDPDLQGQIQFESQILPHFELVRTITHQPFELESPNLVRKCIVRLLRSLLILDLIGYDLHFHFQCWNLFLYQIYLCSFCIILSETRRLLILVRPSLATDRISLGIWLNIRFVVNYRGAFRSIVAIAIYLLASKDRHLLWITAVPLPRRCLQSQQHSGSRLRGIPLALSGPPNMSLELDHRYLMLLLFRQPTTSAQLYLAPVWSVVLVQTQLQSI